jgi:hypothetical protein
MLCNSRASSVLKFEGTFGPATKAEGRATRRRITKLLAIYEAHFARGRGHCLLYAVDLCLRTGTPVPPWATNAFCDRMLSWLAFKAQTLDDAFAIQPRHHKTLEAKRNRTEKAPLLVAEIGRRHQKTGKSPTAIIEDLAAEFDVSDRTIWAYYNDPSLAALRTLHGLKKRKKRKKRTES